MLFLKAPLIRFGILHHAFWWLSVSSVDVVFDKWYSTFIKKPVYAMLLILNRHVFNMFNDLLLDIMYLLLIVPGISCA